MPNRRVNGSVRPRIGSGSGVREPIAIVGIGCRFPGRANNPEAFWNLLESSTDAITEVPAERWNLQAFYDADPSRPGKTYSRWGGFVEGIDRFDPHAFGISPREAARMDPQQRLLLEVAWESLEDGGLTLERLSGSNTAVFVGISSFDYSVLETSFRDRGGIDVYSNTGGSLSIAANRISYCFNLRGPSMAVDTACSSALVAVHLACESLWRDGCSMALAGGVNALLLPDWYVGFCRMGMLSPEGRCRAFDASASGFVRSEGAGIVALKPLSQALADGDRVYAVIRGTAVNQDGHTQGMTVPSEEAQAALILQACQRGGVAPAEVQYVEAHGTGTQVGDPIEARALGRALSGERADGRPCLVGSVKTNIGHLEAGAGIAGLIKVALALHHRRIPGNLHFDRPNPDIDFDSLRLRVPTRSESWPADQGAATAGVNAFGFGGTNAHVVLQEAPVPINGSKRRGPEGETPRSFLIPLSARGPEALHAAARLLAEFVTQRATVVSLEEIASNAALRRTHHEDRVAIVVNTLEELARSLDEFAAGQIATGTIEGRATGGRSPRTAFVCSGQGPQWWGMGRELLRTEPVFRKAVARCDTIMRQLGSWTLLDELTADESASQMDVTAIAQPCLFAIQVGLAALWDSWGVRPEALVGHSVGEVAAAYLAGVFNLEDAVRIIYHRGRCMEQAPARGRMLAAALTPDEARSLIAEYGDRVALAAVNSPGSVTLSGEIGALEECAERMKARGTFYRFLKVQYAFHSAQMDPIRAELLAALEGIRPKVAALPLFSTVHGRRIEGPELGPGYWWENVRQLVCFADGVNGLIERATDLVVELSPHPVLASSVTECFAHQGKKTTVLPSLHRQEGERATLLRSLGALHVQGYPVDWKGVFPSHQRFVRLPLYPWQRERCWHESDESRASRLTPPAHPLLGVSRGGPWPEWEARLDLRLMPYLADHRVRHAVILPATAYLELAFGAARETLGAEGCELRNITLANPCFLTPDEPLWVQSAFDPETSTLQVSTRPAQDSRKWTAHLTTVLRPRPAEPESPPFALDAIRRRCPRAYSHDQCYDYLRLIGLDYGPLFQGIEHVHQGDREALGSVRLPEGLEPEEGAHLFHPALLDACLQVVIPADGDFDRRDGGLYLPWAIEQVQFFLRPGRHVWAHARLLEKTPRQSLAEVDIYDEEGRLAVRLRGLQSRRVMRGLEDSLDDMLFAYQWQPQPLPEASPPAAPGSWLIFADEGGLGARLAERLRARGDECILTTVGPEFDGDGTRYRVNPALSADLLRLVQAVNAPGRLPCKGVVHLWNLDAPPATRLTAPILADAQTAGVLSIVHLVQAWEQGASAQSTPLVLVTRGAQSVGDRPEAVAVAQGPVIGLGRVIAAEYPRLACKLVDLDPKVQDEGEEPAAPWRMVTSHPPFVEQPVPDSLLLFAEVQADDGEDEVAWRESTRYAHRFQPSPVAVTPPHIGVPYHLAIPRPGTLDGLEAHVLHRRPPGQGEVEIEVDAAGLNFSDVMKVLGLYPGLPEGPVPLGAECAGRISAVGDGVTALRVGDEVVAATGFAFGSHVLARAELVAPKPPGLGFEEAATLPIAFLTATYALEYLARLSPGETLLIHAASGGVGHAAIQIARRAHAKIFATAGSSEKRDYLRSLGIETVMDSRSLDFADEVRRRTGGRGADVILNSLSGAAINSGLDVLADYGRFLEIGKRDIYQNARLDLQPFRKNLSFFAIDLDRVLRERPALLGGLLQDIVRRVREGILTPLPHQAWPLDEAVEAFRSMQHGKHIGKLVLSTRGRSVAAVPAEDEPLTFRADGTYLITGGLGGFGLEVAQWMAGRGAGNLVLLGRRGVQTEEARRAVAAIERLGARVVVRAVDVSQAEDVSRVLAEIDHDLPPLRGVIHAAMVLQDALLVNLDRDLLERVLAPKVSGAWNLHSQTAGRPLDLFVLFSSLSSVLGHAGQGNYAAANAFLDALAWHRRAQGLPALTVNWGYLGEVGYLARRGELGERLERQGVLSFTVQQALTLLEKALQREHVQVSVLRLEWSRWRGLGVTSRVSPRFAHLCRRDDGDTLPTGALPSIDAIRAAAPSERGGLVGALLRDKVALVLGTKPERLDDARPLLQLGIDSLMAVELRNWIEGELRVNLPIADLLRSPSISGLAKLLAERFSAVAGTPPLTCSRNGEVVGGTNGRVSAVNALEPAPEDIVSQVEDLSNEQVDALLTTLLNGRVNDARR
ncbi:type I polyketide synthase [Singulisphaera acidiphila]|uniref:Polyketide synthase family protein n=1 Tax=Singulisphaera acidiphila (strain ATCC BAA-1392 / DSM 18658 / VKM B-2454 / MOB10) TaxID=886293 RepID=L0DAL9_SINAD|nr:type I polyketide synthase [Singulisphaera acidiphila]AGA26414.1 polyketide synthase family protein [Singulisphaera acidiphila DSM 18658]